MKRATLPIFLSFILLFPCQAQRRKATPPPEPTITPQEAMEMYDFEKAQEILENEIERLTKKRQPTEELEALLELAQLREAVLQATEKVMIIDSLVIPKEELLPNLPLGEENGVICTSDQYLQEGGSKDYYVFRNQLGNQVIYAYPNKAGNSFLYQSHLLGRNWSDPERLSGLNKEDVRQNFPFMLSDGATLYFAAENEEGLGGYDIYMTRYDSDDKTFLEPENLGMPYNSPANDYLYVLDEFNNLGWFVTDRNQPEGKVCLYTFIPNSRRTIYNQEEIGSPKLQRLARIHNIQETWSDMDAVNAAKERLANLRKTTSKKTQSSGIKFIINDTKTITEVSQLKNSTAQERLQSWQQKKKLQDTLNTQLSQLRSQYSTATATQKTQLTQQILDLETQTEALYDEIKKLEKEIRQFENN